MPATRQSGWKRIMMVRLLFVVAILHATTSLADAQQQRTEQDAPTAAEQARIEAVLRERGFVRWKEIEREDDGRTWEVDDAYTADGRRFDLRLLADTLREISRHAED